MHFQTKNTLKNNLYYTPKHPLNILTLHIFKNFLIFFIYVHVALLRQYQWNLWKKYFEKQFLPHSQTPSYHYHAHHYKLFNIFHLCSCCFIKRISIVFMKNLSPKGVLDLLLLICIVFSFPAGPIELGYIWEKNRSEDIM